MNAKNQCSGGRESWRVGTDTGHDAAPCSSWELICDNRLAATSSIQICLNYNLGIFPTMLTAYSRQRDSVTAQRAGMGADERSVCVYN